MEDEKKDDIVSVMISIFLKKWFLFRKNKEAQSEGDLINKFRPIKAWSQIYFHIKSSTYTLISAPVSCRDFQEKLLKCYAKPYFCKPETWGKDL